MRHTEKYGSLENATLAEATSSGLRSPSKRGLLQNEGHHQQEALCAIWDEIVYYLLETRGFDALRWS